jgi:hypothetical protein
MAHVTAGWEPALRRDAARKSATVGLGDFSAGEKKV